MKLTNNYFLYILADNMKDFERFQNIHVFDVILKINFLYNNIN